MFRSVAHAGALAKSTPQFTPGKRSPGVVTEVPLTQYRTRPVMKVPKEKAVAALVAQSNPEVTQVVSVDPPAPVCAAEVVIVTKPATAAGPYEEYIPYGGGEYFGPEQESYRIRHLRDEEHLLRRDKFMEKHEVIPRAIREPVSTASRMVGDIFGSLGDGVRNAVKKAVYGAGVVASAKFNTVSPEVLRNSPAADSLPLWAKVVDKAVGLSPEARESLRIAELRRGCEEREACLELQAEVRALRYRAARVGLTDVDVDRRIQLVFTNHKLKTVWQRINTQVKEPMQMSPLGFRSLVKRCCAALKPGLDQEQVESLESALEELVATDFLWNHFRV